MSDFALYIHIPYCLHKCPYCDFNSYAATSIPEREYTSAVLSELDYRASEPVWEGKRVRSIYFGGGTPSLFSPFSINRIIAAIFSSFLVDEFVEITLEANPGTISSETAFEYRELGVNRLSIGAQSFRQKHLEKLGRMHTAEQTVAAVGMAREAGFSNINLDLMFGLPLQTLRELHEDMEQILALQPQHISAYGLTIEKGTPFYQAYKRGQLKLPKEKHIIEMMGAVAAKLAEENFVQYEISNFAQPGKEAQHNLSYWLGHDYLGLGAGAHSFVKTEEGGKRWSNAALPKRYLQKANDNGDAHSWCEDLRPKDLVFERFFLGLRMLSGVEKSAFERDFGQKVEDTYPALLKVLSAEGFIENGSSHVRLSSQGLLLADSVIENFSDVERPPKHFLGAAENLRSYKEIANE